MKVTMMLLLLLLMLLTKIHRRLRDLAEMISVALLSLFSSKGHQAVQNLLTEFLITQE